MSVEEILAETCTDTLSRGLSNVLSESDDDDENESYNDFEPDIAKKLKTERGSSEKQDSDNKNEIYAAGGDFAMEKTRHYLKLKLFSEEIHG
jgi:hypothetical protein